MTQIDPDRLLSTLESLRHFGREGTGVHRPALTPEDLQARQWLRTRLADIGYHASIDRFGTVLGRAPGDAPTILIGSHTDTVPHGGWLDGALGVCYGLEIATARTEALGLDAARVDVVSFQDEEGTFVPFLGSRGFIGEITDPDSLADRQALDGRRLGDALDVDAIRERPILQMDVSRTGAYLEAHIEQGPRLENKRLPIGIVTAIVGIRRFRIVVEGRADHAGTTPLELRRDAGAAALRLAVALLDLFQAAGGSETVWNIGHIAFQPGALNVVPAEAAFTLEFRDVQESRLDALEANMRALVSGHSRVSALPIAINQTTQISATLMTTSIVDAFEGAARDLGVGSMRLSSGAGHDAMILARRVPAGMLFVPSIAGRSHDVSENTRAADIIMGAQVMARAVDRLLGTL
ncbi:MAG: hydantoinase/carbamoylase family amidase [Bradyrhizobiaceae bacterium]|nr:hydantoinase/carbamoylase family amidase [Bradyrhizobiaceae bacterium]